MSEARAAWGDLKVVREPGQLEYRGQRVRYVRAVVDSQKRVMMHMDAEQRWFVLGEPIDKVAALIEESYRTEGQAR